MMLHFLFPEVLPHNLYWLRCYTITILLPRFEFASASACWQRWEPTIAEARWASQILLTAVA
jgi:hypothetical protein